MKEGDRVELALHKSKTSGKRERRQVVMEFVMKLDAKRISGIQAFIAEAWRNMRRVGSGICLTELDRQVESQNVRFFGLPKDEVDVITGANEPALEMEGVDLAELRLEKALTGEVFLFFKVTQPLSRGLWNWLYHSEQAETIYAEFGECQQELPMDAGAAKTKTAKVQ